MTKEEEQSRPVETPLEDLKRNALAHYEEASLAIHAWDSFVFNAIKYYNPALTAELSAARSELEKLRLSVREILPEYYSASFQDVCNAVDREMELRSELQKAKEEIEAMNKGVLTDEEIQKESEQLYPDDLGKQVAFCEALLSIKSRVEHKIKVGLLMNQNALFVYNRINEQRKIRLGLTESGPLVLYIEGDHPGEKFQKQLSEQSSLLEEMYDSLGSVRHLLDRMAEYSQENAENLDLTEMSDCVDVALTSYETYKGKQS